MGLNFGDGAPDERRIWPSSIGRGGLFLERASIGPVMGPFCEQGRVISGERQSVTSVLVLKDLKNIVKIRHLEHLLQ